MAKQTKTKIDLFGWGYTFGYGFITPKVFRLLTSAPMDLFECTDYDTTMETAGPNLDTVQLLINGKCKCSSLDEIRDNFSVDTADTTVVTFPPRKKYCLVTSEEEKGIWTTLTVDGKFDKSKLIFCINQLQLVGNCSVSWITAKYDGVPLESEEDGTEHKGGVAVVIDTDGDEHAIETE
jgi:hypothetical protein